MTRGAKITVNCKRCGKAFEARIADRKRGWAKFCSKSCKAVEQENRTGQYAAYKERVENGTDGDEDIDYEGNGWDAHKDVF